MFTGIVEELGRFVSADGERYRFAAELVLDESELGASIACNGCCLTLVDKGGGGGRPTSRTRRCAEPPSVISRRVTR